MGAVGAGSPVSGLWKALKGDRPMLAPVRSALPGL
jgi:hypothetical protein